MAEKQELTDDELIREFKRQRWCAIEKADRPDAEIVMHIKKAAVLRQELIRRGLNVPF